jgi:hypothetical protein
LIGEIAARPTAERASATTVNFVPGAMWCFAMPVNLALKASVQVARLALPLRPVERLAQVQEPGTAPAMKREAEEDWS